VKNLHLIALCVILFGFSTFFRKVAVDRIHPFQFQVVATFVYLALLPFWLWLISRMPPADYNLTGISFAVLCNLVHICGAIAMGYLFRGSPNAGVISAMVSMSPLITLSLSMALLGEHMTAGKGLAFFFALLSAILVNF
jgi:uncharacterized membrane protein